VQTPPVGLKSNEFGRIIGWGETSGRNVQLAVETTENITVNLTRQQVQAFKSRGLTRNWVETQVKLYEWRIRRIMARCTGVC
jgi:hypothetical protein